MTWGTNKFSGTPPNLKPEGPKVQKKKLNFLLAPHTYKGQNSG